MSKNDLINNFLTPYPIEQPNEFTISRGIDTLGERLNRIEQKIDRIIDHLKSGNHRMYDEDDVE